MALTLTPGGDDDDTLSSLEFFQAYCAGRGYSLTSFTEASQEQSLRRSTVWVEGLGTWPGVRASASQRRVWPRVGATRKDGTEIDKDIIPADVSDAVCEAAIYDLNSPGMLNGTLNISEIVSSAGAGPAKVTFQGATTLEGARTMLLAVNDLLADLLQKSSSTKPFLRS